MTEGLSEFKIRQRENIPTVTIDIFRLPQLVTVAGSYILTILSLDM